MRNRQNTERPAEERKEKSKERLRAVSYTHLDVYKRQAMGQEAVIQKAVVMGARDFIVKPFRKDEFLRIVDSCFPIEK